MGRVDVDRLEREITVDEFYGWYEFWKAEPFGLDWHRTALLAHTNATVMGGKPPRDFCEQFLPSYDPTKPMSDEDMMEQVAKLKARINGK